MLRAATGLVFAVGFTGCGLTLDLDPADPQGRDGGGADAARVDAGTPDTSTPDTGPPPGCEADPECDDADACNGRERCADGACVPGEPVACDDGDPCNGDEVCAAGACTTRSGIACRDDSNLCNGIEICVPFVGCTVGAIPDCSDGIDCTDDRCNPSTGCEHVPDDARCRDDGPGTCDPVIGCQYPTCRPTVCTSDPCFLARCEGETCVREARCPTDAFCCAGECARAGCDDSNPCTADACGESGCEHTPISGPCTDGDACTIGDACGAAGSCVSGAIRDCSDGEPCSVDICTAGACSHRPAAGGSPCTDGDACTVGDTCRLGLCVPGLGIPLCDDFDSCTMDVCTPVLGCVNVSAVPGTSCGANMICAMGCVCAPGFSDCDGIAGGCECPGVCDPSGMADVCQAPCAAGDCLGSERCCTDVDASDWGHCYPVGCASCCTPAAT